MSAAKKDLTPEEVDQLLVNKSHIAQVLDRGLTVERLSVKHLLPPDRIGFFVRDRTDSIQRMKALGARVEVLPEETRERLGHDSADGTYKVGDVILMTMSRQQYNLVQQVNDERTAGKLEQSRRDFRAGMQRLGVEHELDREV